MNGIKQNHIPFDFSMYYSLIVIYQDLSYVLTDITNSFYSILIVIYCSMDVIFIDRLASTISTEFLCLFHWDIIDKNLLCFSLGITAPSDDSNFLHFSLCCSKKTITFLVEGSSSKKKKKEKNEMPVAVHNTFSFWLSVFMPALLIQYTGI